MSVNSILSLLSRKSLLFLCLTVGSVVFFPSVSFAEYGFADWTSVAVTSPTPNITISCSDSSSPRWFMSLANFDATKGDGEYNTSSENTHLIFGNPLCTGTLTITSIPSGYYVFFGGSVITGTNYSIDRVKIFYFDTDTNTLSVPSDLSGVYSYTTGFNSSLNTRFTDLDIMGTSTLNINANYYLDGAEIDTSVSTKNPSYVKFWYATSSTFQKINEPISVVAGSSTVDTNLTGLSDGTYDLLVGFSNFGCSSGLSGCPFPDSYVYTTFSVSGGILVATTTNEFYDRVTPLDENMLQPCGLTDLGGCMINAGMFLFVPTDDSIAEISDSFVGLQETFPFVYAFQVNDYVDTLFTATSTDAGITASTTWGTITFINRAKLQAVPYSFTFRTVIGYGMWLTFLWGAYRLVLRMFNPTTV